MEIYINIGIFNNTHFFTHIKKNNDIEEELSTYQIYNFLIHKKIITDPQKNVIIYKLKDYPNCDVIAIQHLIKDEFLEFNKSDLEEVFKQLNVNIKTEKNTYGVIYYKTHNAFNIMPVDIQKINFQMNNDINMNINNIEYIKTTKNIE